MIMLNSRSDDCVLNTINTYIFYIEKFTTQFKTTEKNDRSP